ncbi:MAG: AraC family transcriptional regulator [Halioglobus sp.]
MTDQVVHEQSILGTLLLPIARVLQNRGFDAIEVIESSGLDPSKIADPDWRVPADKYNTLMRRCVELTQDEAFGLHAAEELQPQVLHGLGLGWLTSDTVYDGLRRLVRFAQLIASIAELELEETDNLVILHLRRTLELEDFEFASRDYGIAMISRMCRLSLGQFLAPVKIEMERPLPTEPERWDYMLATKVTFDSDKTCITWSRSDIEGKILTGDPKLARANDEQAAAYIDTFINTSFSREVMQKLLERLPDGAPEQKQIASDLCVSNRTLQRKLKDEGASFNDLLQDCRLQLAKKYLRLNHRSVVETSYMLGFSEPSAFSRAFKRWTGMSPAQFRDRP